jgi:hypothetical protein
MRNFIFLFVPFAAMLLMSVGCGPDTSVSSGAVKGAIAEFESFKAYQPVKAVFLPLSDVYMPDKSGQADTIVAYLALQDGVGSAVKAPAVFRFELYQFKPLSSDPKGKRIHIWDDMDLTAFADNNRYWRDYLRAYEFKFQYNCPNCLKYVLEVTCMCPSGARLTTSITLGKKQHTPH